MIESSNPNCPMCRTKHSQVNLSELPIVYQLIQENSSKQESRLDTIDKSKIVNDQIDYLEYILNELCLRNEKCSNNISKVRHQIDKNSDLLIEEIANISRRLKQELEKNYKRMCTRISALASEVKKLIEVRKTLLIKIGRVFSSKTNLSNAEKNKFLELDYPEFTLNLKKYCLDVDIEKILSTLGESLMRFYVKPFAEHLLKFSNNQQYEEYKKSLEGRLSKLPNQHYEKQNLNKTFMLSATSRKQKKRYTKQF